MFWTVAHPLNAFFFLQEPILNVQDLKEIQSEITLIVPDPVTFTNSHDGMEVVSTESFTVPTHRATL